MSAWVRAFVLAGVAAGAFVASAAAQIQPPPQPTGQSTVGEVTVTGHRTPDDEMVRTVIAPFVANHAARDRVSGLLVRAPPQGLCPVTLGMPQAFDDFVTRRITEVAGQVGAIVEPAGKCHANVEVLFTTDPQRIINALAKQTGGQILGMHFVGETGRLSHVSRPVQAWYITGTSGDSCSQDKRIGPDGTVDSEHAHVRVDQAYHGALDTGTGSLVPPRNRSQFVNVLIVADAAKLAGHEIGPIADYMAMLALSQARSLDACSPLPSILDLMATGCSSRPPPRSLTDNDLAFLKALYAADPSVSGNMARTQVAHDMAKDIAPPTKP